MSVSVPDAKDAKARRASTEKPLVMDLLALSEVAGLGDEGIARVWQMARQEGNRLTKFYHSDLGRLQSHYGLSASAAKYVCHHRDQFRSSAEDLLRRAEDLGIVILAPGAADYPDSLDEFYGGAPPPFYARGNLGLLKSPTAAILNSAHASSQGLSHTLGLASRLAEADWTLLTGNENAANNVVGLAAKRAGGNLIVVFNQGLLTALEGHPHREPIPLARHADEGLDLKRILVLSSFRLGGRWQKGNGARRDRLLVGLAQTAVGIEIKPGGGMESLCREAIRLKRRIFVCQQGELGGRTLANAALLELGAQPLVPDGVGSNCDLVLKPRPPAALAPALEGNDLERRRQLGQFFTPAVVARFIWDFLEVINGRPFDKTEQAIDPACGDGVFFRASAERGQLPLTCLLGVDIDETLAPAWRQDPLLRKARLYRTNGLLDNPAIGLLEGEFDLVIGNPPFGGTGLRDLLKLLEESAASRRGQEPDLFGPSRLSEQTALASPPLPRYERVLLDCLVRQLSRYACWQLSINFEGDEDGLAETMPDDLFAGFEFSNQRRPGASDYERMAQLIANWSPERLLDDSKTEVRDTIRRLAGTAIEVFFMERFVRLAKPGGLIGVIVPQSIVASDQLGPLRTWLLGQMDLLAVISLPQKVFSGVGANARTSILFARRLAKAEATDPSAQSAMNGTGGHDADRTILMAAPPNDEVSLEDYLDEILGCARKERKMIQAPLK